MKENDWSNLSGHITCVLDFFFLSIQPERLLLAILFFARLKKKCITLTAYMYICILIQTKWLSVNRWTHWSSRIYRLIWMCLLYQHCSYSGSTSSLEPRTPHPCRTNQPLTHENILARTVWLELSCHVPGFKRQKRKSHLPDRATGSVRARTVSLSLILSNPTQC